MIVFGRSGIGVIAAACENGDQMILRRNVNLLPAVALRGNHHNLLRATGHLHVNM